MAIYVFIFLNLITFLKDYNFYGFLKLAKFDVPVTVGFDKKELPRIDSFQFNDCIDAYSKKKFKNEPNEVIVIKSQNQKYFVSVILNQQQKRKIETSKEHIFLTLQKTMECGRLSIYIIDVSEHSY